MASDLSFADQDRAPFRVLASVLSKLVARNDSLPFSLSHATPFHSLQPPALSIEQFLERLLKHAMCSNETVILSLIYIDRIIEYNRSFVLTSLNIHRLLITSLMVAAKWFDDKYYTNSYYAMLGGISTAELNSLEINFLFLINFSLNVSEESYRRYFNELCKHASSHTDGSRGSPPSSPAMAGPWSVPRPMAPPAVPASAGLGNKQSAPVLSLPPAVVAMVPGLVGASQVSQQLVGAPGGVPSAPVLPPPSVDVGSTLQPLQLPSAFRCRAPCVPAEVEVPLAASCPMPLAVASASFHAVSAQTPLPLPPSVPPPVSVAAGQPGDLLPPPAPPGSRGMGGGGGMSLGDPAAAAAVVPAFYAVPVAGAHAAGFSGVGGTPPVPLAVGTPRPPSRQSAMVGVRAAYGGPPPPQSVSRRRGQVLGQVPGAVQQASGGGVPPFSGLALSQAIGPNSAAQARGWRAVGGALPGVPAGLCPGGSSGSSSGGLAGYGALQAHMQTAAAAQQARMMGGGAMPPPNGVGTFEGGSGTVATLVGVAMIA